MADIFEYIFSKIFHEPLGELNIRKIDEKICHIFFSKLAITSLSLQSRAKYIEKNTMKDIFIKIEPIITAYL